MTFLFLNSTDIPTCPAQDRRHTSNGERRRCQLSETLTVDIRRPSQLCQQLVLSTPGDQLLGSSRQDQLLELRSQTATYNPASGRFDQAARRDLV
ncbi:hypothetical protein BaRGS_00036376 [Batillaria attramentaria]|uniref:Uncharacterized protein n=1 Tax=Batillaria attramentaria TaxID=370345 RepID=A0ABD0JC21_9CAEN